MKKEAETERDMEVGWEGGGGVGEDGGLEQ